MTISKHILDIFKRYKSTNKLRKFNLTKEKFEITNYLLSEAYIIACIDGINFKKFCATNHFHKPVDLRNVSLMNSCALSLMNRYRNDIMCAYGFSDEFNLIFKPNTNVLKRNSK